MKTKIVKCSIRMYTMGTGDCFILFFKNEDDETLFKLMIDCGVYNIDGATMDRYAKQIIRDTGGKLDAILITHEHQDHVLGFQRSEKIFRDKLKIKELWLPWTEDENDPLVTEFKTEYGKKKKSLAMANDLLQKSVKEKLFEAIYMDEFGSENIIKARKDLAAALDELTVLNTSGLNNNLNEYVGGLKGMEVIKSLNTEEPPRYLQTESILDNIEGLDNIRIYVLGPPRMWKNVKKEHGKEGETYKHNKELELVRSFSSLPFEEDRNDKSPFGDNYVIHPDKNLMQQIKDDKERVVVQDMINTYRDTVYRRIDYDWLISAANLSLRLTRGINNLSAVLAIEFVESGKVMLFPGDAEIGSWQSWFDLDWNLKGKDGQTHLTIDLLNRTVFYKVAHHLSHNGTPKELGMKHLNHQELVAMATLDYENISSRWTTTMPNRALLKDLLEVTKGKFIVTNEKDLFMDKSETIELSDEIKRRLKKLSKAEQQKYKDALIDNRRNYKEYTVDGSA